MAVAVIYFLILIIAYEIVTAPLSYYRGYILPHRYGISTQALKSWLGDIAKAGSLGLVLGLAAIAVVYWLLNEFPSTWWLIAWGLMLAVSVVMTIITPVVLVPLFFKVRPLPDEDLKTKLEQLASKAKVQIRGIYTLDFSSKGTAANAALIGMGRTRRIVISDTLVQHYTVPEIEVVTAHEIGHHVNRDIYRLFIIQMLVWLIGVKIIDVILKAVSLPLGFNGIGVPGVLPLLLLLFGLFGTLASPLLNSYTRYIERQADLYSLRLADNTSAFINAMTRLTDQNLGVAYPGKWEELLFYDHPSYGKRIEQAQNYEKNKT